MDSLEPIDDGLQIERTTLSWRRTFLSAGVLLAGLLKVSIAPMIGWDVIILLLGIFSLATLLVTRQRKAAVYSRFTLVDDLPENSQVRLRGAVSVVHWGWSLLLTITLSTAGFVAMAAIIADTVV